MAFTRIHHVGMLVDELETGRRVYCDGFGLSVDEHRSPWPDGRTGDFDGVRSIEIPLGEMHLEISAPQDEDSPAARFVAERRAGMYYLSFASDDIQVDVQMLKDNGIQTEGSWDGEGPVFLDPSTCLGLRFQITPEDNYFVHPYYKGDGTLTGMAHVGIAARSVDEIRALLGGAFGLFEDLTQETGLSENMERDPNEPANDPVHLIEYPIGGSVIEISIPLDETSGTARLVQQRAVLGAVYHHICPFAQDVHRAVDMGLAVGIQQIGTIPPKEVSTQATAWFHPRTCAGTLVEIWNRPPGKQHTKWQRPGK
jgi:catechol 2,3-dioxygenase-like lactoylglutathione lyase family enzyme